MINQETLPPTTLKLIIESKSKVLINNIWYFFFFMLFAIIGILLFYRWTVNEVLPLTILSFLWIMFWSNSERKGQILLIIASVFGYFHELLGVIYGYFTYLGGVIGNVPIWILPGYGAIFWSSYNLWHIFELRYSKSQWFPVVNYFIPVSLTILLAFDFFFFDLAQNPIAIMAKFSLAFLLFKNFKELRLAYFVGFFTVLTEFSGEILGTWYHPDFSLLSLMTGYVFLLWICITIADSIDGVKKWGVVEVVAASLLTLYYIVSMAGIFSI
jgi:hypothetical protein